jgi:hypothetical protein
MPKKLPKSPVAKQKELERRAKAKQRKLDRKEKKKLRQAIRMAPKKAYAAWSQAVRERAGQRCEMCGVVEPPERTVTLGGKKRKDGTISPLREVTRRDWYLNAHHVLPRTYYKLYRYEVMNGLCLCPKCHKHGQFAVHMNSPWLMLWLAEYRPAQLEWVLAHVGRPEWAKVEGEQRELPSVQECQ